MKKNFIKTAVLCLIAGLTLCGCSKNDKDDDSVSVTGVSLNETAKTLIEGETFTLTATITPENASNKTLVWTSSNTAIATVSNGTVSALAVGKAVIIVSTDGGKTALCTVTVESAVVPVSSVILNTNKAALLLGESLELTHVVAPENATNKTVVWASSIAEVASVNNGTVSAHAVGETVITISTADGGKTASCTVRVEGYKMTMVLAATASEILLRMKSDEPIIIDWGDPNIETFNTYNTLQYVYHDYAPSPDSRIITITGNTIDVLECSQNMLIALDVSRNPKLTELYCGGSQLSALDLSKNTALRFVECYGNNLSAGALNALLGSLHANTIPGKTISIGYNPGTNDCDGNIAERKGWTIRK